MCKERFMEAQPFVYDLRRPAICRDKENSPKNDKRWMFPKNYDDIVKYGKIETGEFFGEEKLTLIYSKDGKQLRYTLIKIDESTTKLHFFYTLCMSDVNEEIRLSKSYYEPFGFSGIDFKTFLPVFEILKTEDPNEPYTLTSEPDADEKARNGKLLYLSKYGKRSTTFYVIRDELRRIEGAKSCISLSFVLTANLYKLSSLLITFLPMLLGESLLKKQNIIARIFGVVFYLPFMPIKVVLNLLAALLKAPILLLVGDKEKYGDGYYTLWQYELIEWLEDLANGVSLLSNEKIEEKKICRKARFLGTWEELNSSKKAMEWFVEHGDDCEEAADVV